MTPEQFQREMSSRGFNCSQIVFSYFAPRFGMNMTQALRISSAFGKGMGRGATCGVISGAYLVLGLIYGSGDKNTDRTLLKEKLKELDGEFSKISENRNCTQILGVDLRNIEQVKEMAIKNPDFMAICPDLVINTIKIIEKIIKES